MPSNKSAPQGRRSQHAPAKMSDIARIAGVHPSTVSRALAGSPLVAQEVRERILEVAAQQGYVVNATARNLRLMRSQTLSVAIPQSYDAGHSLTDPFFADIITCLADEITQRGYGMFLQKIVPPMDRWLPKLIASRSTDGVIVVGQSTVQADIESAARGYLPLVVWGAAPESQSYCTVGTDNLGGARLAAEHLLQQGRRNIIFLGDASMPEVGLRHQGYLQALRAIPGAMPPRIVHCRMTSESAYDALSAELRSGARFDGLCAASDVVAMNAMRALANNGLTVPGDVAVVGFDDIPMAAHMHPSLTTVRQDLRLGAQLLVELLLRRVAGEATPSVAMDGQLVIRESSRAAC